MSFGKGSGRGYSKLTLLKLSVGIIVKTIENPYFSISEITSPDDSLVTNRGTVE